MEVKNSKKNFSITKDKIKVNFESIDVIHGRVKTRGYLFENVAYISDCNLIPSLPFSLSNLSINVIHNINILTKSSGGKSTVIDWKYSLK